MGGGGGRGSEESEGTDALKWLFMKGVRLSVSPV